MQAVETVPGALRNLSYHESSKIGLEQNWMKVNDDLLNKKEYMRYGVK
jgi:hypothetical protein